MVVGELDEACIDAKPASLQARDSKMRQADLFSRRAYFEFGSEDEAEAEAEHLPVQRLRAAQTFERPNVASNAPSCLVTQCHYLPSTRGATGRSTKRPRVPRRRI